MGFWKGLGKAGLKTGKVAGKAIGGAADITGKGIVGYGNSVIKNAVNNPLKTAAAIGSIGAAGYILGDMDHEPQPSKTAGKAMLTAAAFSAIPGAATVGTAVGAGLVGGAAAIGGFSMGLGSSMLKTPDAPLSFSNMGDIKFSKLGVGLLVGGALYEGMGKAHNKFITGRMGTNDGMMRTSTPIIPQSQNSPSYANNGGATGDLVFSMYNNR